MAREAAGLGKSDVAVRRAGASGGMLERVGLGTLARAAPDQAISRLARIAPEVEALLALTEAGLGPVLALPEEWIRPAGP